MESIPIVVKHQGKKYDVDVDPESTGDVLKFQLFSLTQVEPDRQKILVKGGQLQDDTMMSSLGLKSGQVLMMMGTPSLVTGAELVRPKDPVRFLEDMSAAEAAKREDAVPGGLVNHGNTCYLNATVQTLRAIPELHQALSNYSVQSTHAGSVLTKHLSKLFAKMNNTQASTSAELVLNALRVAHPQFAETVTNGPGHAQQDAEEAWSQILATLKDTLKNRSTQNKNDNTSGNGNDGEQAEASTTSLNDKKSFTDEFMAGEFSSVLECDDTSARELGEVPVNSREVFYKLNCHIDATVNHVRDGLLAGLTEKLEKQSTLLGTDVQWTKRSRVSRLPNYLTVHFVRFFWKRDSGKKAKILRKVMFPQELDMLELCTDELRQVLAPVRDKVREIRGAELEASRARAKRRKHTETSDTKGDASSHSSRVQSAGTTAKTGASADSAASEKVDFKTDEELDAEREAALGKARRALRELVHGGKGEVNRTGLYELIAVVTHQGVGADSGHYTAFVKQQPRRAKGSKNLGDNAGTGADARGDGRWWWFNDDRVSEVEVDMIEGLAGGGQSHSALLLLYRAVPIPLDNAEGASEDAQLDASRPAVADDAEPKLE